MNKKYLIIAAIAVIAVVGVGFFLLNNGETSQTVTEHNTLVLSKSAYMEVPKIANASSKADKKGIFYYEDAEDDLNITSCSNISTSSSAGEMKKLKDSVATGAKKTKENDVIIYEKNGTYSAFVKNTKYNDTLLIQTSFKNILLECLKSLNYHDPTTKIKFNDTNDSGSGSGGVISAIEETEQAVQASYESSNTASTTTTTTSSSSESSYSGSGSGGYSDFGFGSSSSGGGSSGGSSGSGEGGYSDFGFD